MEVENTLVIIIDVIFVSKFRIINIYRSFIPPNDKTQIDAFKEQLAIIKTSLTNCNNCDPIV